MNEEYKKLKSNNKYSIIIVKSGTFYNAYGKDAIIIGWFLGLTPFFYGNKLTVAIHKVKINLLLSRLRVKEISYILIDSKESNKYIGKNEKYITLYNEISLVHKRNVLLDEIFELLPNLQYKKLKEIKKIIERK